MAIGLTVEGDIRARGAVIADQLIPTTGTVGNNEVKTSDPLEADKLYHRQMLVYSQKHGTATIAERKVIYVAKEAGDWGDFLVGVVVACIGDSTITVNLYKNGTTVLNAAVVLDNSNVAFAKEQGTFADDVFVANDVLEIVVTVSAGTGTLGQGLFVLLWGDEQPTT